ncbi:MAG: hypothetical protein KJ583_06645 [Nanoarchaeota archaeon]|nr:hypothetical protein [Nanoarchaeota archaeon]MBU1269069.1 hypothetical protein [Nanoarchaeota archaeon]MBU1604964.1 hypothetical protein [Nanoarchaeota archaeon]MBU2443306.1 hypothetical protein [Nanoarchaeota archaeon]
MNIKKAIKKVVALGTGLTMIGATIMGASALTLSDYPQPFIKNGLFGGKIIVGAAASPADVLGAIDISASLQAAAKTSVDVSGKTTTTVSGGVLLEDSTSQDFNYGDYLSTSKIDDQDFPELFADGTLEDDDGIEYDFSQFVVTGNETLKFDLVDKDVYDMPIMYLDLDAATNSDYFLTYTVDFDSGDEVDWVDLDDGETLEMFGTVWTVKNIAAAGDSLILYGSDVTTLVALNTPKEISVDGKTYTLNILGANSDDSSVQVAVNGEVKSMISGQTKTIGGIKVYVKDVFISNVAGSTASAKLFIGSKELNLGVTNSSWTQVQVDNKDLEGVDVRVTGAATAVSKIEFGIDTSSIANDDTDEDYNWLAMGDTFVDPMFGFEVKFVGASQGFTDKSRDYVSFASSNDDLIVDFANNKGVKYSFSPYTLVGTSNLTSGEDFAFGAKLSIAKNKIFILEEASSSSAPISRIFKFTGTSDSDTKANFKDLGSGTTYTLGTGDSIGDTGVTVTVDSKNVVNLSDFSKTYVYTKSGAWLNFTSSANAATQTVTITEDKNTVNKDEITGATYTVAVTYDTTDEEVNIAKPGSGFAEDDDNNGDYFYGVSNYGTYYKQEADDNTKLELWFPSEDVDYNVYFAASGAVTSTTGTTAGTAYNVNPIAVGIAVLDINAPALGSTPMIIVGGPCANTVAAEVMGMPTPCGKDFESGKAVIKWYDAKSALLVAGYEAIETQGASRVLADYMDYGLSGTEVEVVVPTLSDIIVKKVA